MLWAVCMLPGLYTYNYTWVLAKAGKQGGFTGLPSFFFFIPPSFLPALQKGIYLGKCV